MIIINASIIIKIDIGKKNVSSIPSPKHVIAIPTSLLSLRIIPSPRKILFLAFYIIICFL